MGRELRRVPPNWEHPKRDEYNPATQRYEPDYKPLYDRSCEEAWTEWQQAYLEWLTGEHARIAAEYGEDKYPLDQPYWSFCRWHGMPPDPEYYRPKWNDGEATWWQVYETVSEGTPVTPPFETREELVEYLIANGDFWDQKRRAEGSSMPGAPWTRKQAEAFVFGDGWAPSLVVTAEHGVQTGVEYLGEMKAKP